MAVFRLRKSGGGSALRGGDTLQGAAVGITGTVAITLADHTVVAVGIAVGVAVPSIPGITRAGPDQGHSHVSEPATIASSKVSAVDGPTRPGGDQDQSRVGV